MSLFRKVQVESMSLIRSAVWRSLVEAVTISSFSHIYAQNALGVYVRNLIEKKKALCPWQDLLTGHRGNEKCSTRAATVWAGSRTKSAGHDILVSFVFLRVENIVSAPRMHILHFVSWVWCCSLRITLPLRFRLDLCLAGNVLSQPGMTTAWGGLDNPPPHPTQRDSLLAQLWLNWTDKCISFHYVYYNLWFQLEMFLSDTDNIRVRSRF